jgi:hypothetical protein
VDGLPRHELLDTTYQLARRAVAKARTEGPAAYVVDADRRGGQVRNPPGAAGAAGDRGSSAPPPPPPIEESWPPADQEEGREKTRERKREREEGHGSKKIEVAAGSYIVRMDQPYSRLADMLLDTQFYRTDDPRPYDDTGWTLGYSKNVNVRRVVNPAILDVAMERVTDFAPKALPRDGIHAVLAEGDIDLYRWLWNSKTDFRVADAPFKEGDKEIPRGSVADRGSHGHLRASLRTVPLAKMPDVADASREASRLALLHTWFRTQDEGWYRLALESLGIPYTYLSTQRWPASRTCARASTPFSFPPCNCDVDDIVWGMPPASPSRGGRPSSRPTSAASTRPTTSAPASAWTASRTCGSS